MQPDPPTSTVAQHASTPTTAELPTPTSEGELQQYPRTEVELQLKTIAEYIRNKKLRPVQWACCHCSRRQQFRDTLDLFDGLRCVDPTCGVSEKGFRICQVHEICDACTVFVDERVPVTTSALKKKREEVREVLKKVKRVYDDVDRLVGFDEAEAGRVAAAVGHRAARDGLQREQMARVHMYRAEMERRQNLAEAMAMECRGEELEDGLWGHGDAGGGRRADEHDGGAREGYGHEQEVAALPKGPQHGGAENHKKRGGIASFFSLGSAKKYI